MDFYGYLRGAHLKLGATIHVPGLGDFVPTAISALDDPLPVAEKRTAGPRFSLLVCDTRRRRRRRRDKRREGNPPPPACSIAFFA